MLIDFKEEEGEEGGEEREERQIDIVGCLLYTPTSPIDLG